jgi:hypothetical protein
MWLIKILIYLKRELESQPKTLPQYLGTTVTVMAGVRSIFRIFECPLLGPRWETGRNRPTTYAVDIHVILRGCTIGGFSRTQLHEVSYIYVLDATVKKQVGIYILRLENNNSVTFQCLMHKATTLPHKNGGRAREITPFCIIGTFLTNGNVTFHAYFITQFQATIATFCWVLIRCMKIRARSIEHSLFPSIMSILWVLIIFWCVCVKCSVLYNGDGLQLTVCGCCSWRMALNVGLDASFDSTQAWKGIREKASEDKSAKVYVTNGEIPAESWTGVML